MSVISDIGWVLGMMAFSISLLVWGVLAAWQNGE
jgi:hypothetical protein